MYISQLILDGYENITSSVGKNALHNLPLIKLTVARFVGTGCVLIIYSNGHSK